MNPLPIGENEDFRDEYLVVAEGMAPSAVSNFCTSTPNSTGSAATISMIGVPSISLNDFHLAAGPLPPTQFGVFFFGPNEMAIPFGNGTRCVGGGIHRLDVHLSSPGGFLTQDIDLAESPIILPNSVLKYQAWFRDPAGGNAEFDLSDGLSVKFSL